MARRDNLAKRRSRLSSEQRVLLEKRAAASLDPSPHLQAIGPRQDRDSLPLSFAQERVWFLDQWQPGNLAYNRPLALRLVGSLDVPTLEEVLTEIQRRHDVLRARFDMVHGRPAQTLAPPRRMNLPVKDLSGVLGPEREIEARRLAREETLRPFNLAQGPLMRGRLLRLSGTDHVLILVFHHIVFDGWSAGVLLKEFVALYDAYAAGRPSPLEDLPVQYADFADWQRQRLQGEYLESLFDYWRQRLAGTLTPLRLPLDYPRPAVRTFEGASQAFQLSPSLSGALRDLCRQENVTLFMALLSAFQVLLHRYSGQTDIIVGSPVAIRAHAETNGLIGDFVNTLVLRADLSGQPSFREVLRRGRSASLSDLAHQDLPLDKLVEALNPDRGSGRHPLFQVMFNFRSLPRFAESTRTETLRIEGFDFDDGIAPLDLTLEAVDQSEGVHRLLNYSIDLFRASTIERMQGHLITLLQGMVADPDRPISRLGMLAESERRQILVDWNRTEHHQPFRKGVHELFEVQVEQSPDSLAVVHGDRTLTYQELNTRANQLAHCLQSMGIGPEIVVALCVERSLEMIVGLLGVLKAGGVYLPLDPEYPRERLEYILQDAGVRAVLTQQRLLPSLPEHGARVLCLDVGWQPDEYRPDNPKCTVTPDNLAYLIYTSGSTGSPKGVMIRHGSLCNYVEATMSGMELSPHDRTLQFSSISFDQAVDEIYPTLARGATLVLRTDSMLDSASAFLEGCRDWEITYLSLPTVYWHEITAQLAEQELAIPERIRLVFIGGDKALADQLAVWQRHATPGMVLVNGYGPTEITVAATTWRLPGRTSADDLPDEVPIGRPIPNTQLYVLDECLEPVPVGVRGELYIGGAGLARGYLNDRGLTASRFIPDPFTSTPGARMYRTGDLVRYRADGNLEFVRRIDRQVKLRGFRVELGEIESLLVQHPAVREAVALAHEDEDGARRLVAYTIPAAAPAPRASELRAYLQKSLPGYMIPSAIVFLDEFPLAPTGKVDHEALPVPVGSSNEPEDGHLPPRDELEGRLVDLWEEVLGVRPVRVRDSFFDLGGHSLLAIRLMARIRNTLDQGLPMRALVQAPTVEQMARLLRKDYVDETPVSPSLVALHSQGSRPPVFMVPGNMGNVYSHLGALARHLGPDQPAYGLQDSPWNPARIEAQASLYLDEVRSVQDRSPYLLVGVCHGCTVAYEMARQLQDQGQQVRLLALVEPTRLRKPSLRTYLEFGGFLLRQLVRRFGRYTRAMARQSRAAWGEYLRLKLKLVANSWAVIHYSPQPFSGRLDIFLTSGSLASSDERQVLVGALGSDAAATHEIPGTHATIVGADETPVDEAHMKALADQLRAIIDIEVGHGQHRPGSTVPIHPAKGSE